MNPLRHDPTRTGLQRRRWAAAFKRRFDAFKRKLVQLVAVEDAFGLKGDGYVFNNRWRFLTTPVQLEEFKKWLKQEIALTILAKAADQSVDEDAWLKEYIAQTYAQGMKRAFDAQRKPALQKNLDFYQGTRDEFLRSAFQRPVSVERVKLIAARSFTDLQGITEQMSAQISRTLVDGIIRGESPRKVASTLAQRVDMGYKRALVIARSEVVAAHAEGQLDALEALGVEEVGVAVEWSTSEMGHTGKGYPSPCALCAPMKGVVFKVAEAHGLIPRHANCMCSFIPANVGESKKGQLRTKDRIQTAIKRSIKAESPKRPVTEQRKRSRWAGASARISKNRPKGIV